MAAAVAAEKHDVHTTLNFFKPNADGSPPAPAYLARPETFERTPDPRQVRIQDVSGNESQYNLEKHGFQFVRHVSTEKDFLNDDQIKSRYYPEIDELLREITGASRVHIFDHTIRRPSTKPKDNKPEQKDQDVKQPPGPTYSVHVDQSYESALSRVPFHLPEDAEQLLKGRIQLINVWRPIKTVKRDPLAVSDSRSVQEDDLIPIGVIYPHGNRTGATLSVRYREDQQWYYKWHQTPEEVVIFKCFDNRAGAQSAKEYEHRAKRVPHSAFEMPMTSGEEGRESIELRCLVFYDNDGVGSDS